MRGELDPAGRRPSSATCSPAAPRCTEVTRPLWGSPIRGGAGGPSRERSRRRPRAGVPPGELRRGLRARPRGRPAPRGRLAAERGEAPAASARLLRLPPERRRAASTGTGGSRPPRSPSCWSRRAGGRRRATPPRRSSWRRPPPPRPTAWTPRATAAGVARTRPGARLGLPGDARRLAGDLPAPSGPSPARRCCEAASRTRRPRRAAGLEASLAADRGRRAQAVRLLDRAIRALPLGRRAPPARPRPVQKAVTVACAGGTPGTVPPASTESTRSMRPMRPARPM